MLILIEILKFFVAVAAITALLKFLNWCTRKLNIYKYRKEDRDV